MAYPVIIPLQAKPITVEIADISTAGQVYVAPGINGKITRITTCLGGTIATANAAITTKISGTAVTGGAITVTQSGSAAGDVDEAIPTANNYFTSTQNIEVETDGASTNTIPLNVVIWVEPA